MELRNARALVTGAGRGVGAGIARSLASAGASVAVCDLDGATARATATEIASLGVRAHWSETDVSDEAQVQAMIAEAAGALGGLDVAVNTVAWIDPPGPVETTPYERWRTGMRINLDSVFLCAKYELPHLRAAGEALLVNISSINGTRGFPNRAVYGASKAAIINLTETLSMENRKYGVRANCLVPGAVVGSVRRQIMRELAAREGTEFPLNDVVYDPPVRAVTEAEIGAYVVFLASDAGSVVNGQALRLGEAPRVGGQVLL